MGVYQEVFDGQVGASLSEFDLLPPFKQKRPKTIQNGAFSEYSYFRMFLDVFF